MKPLKFRNTIMPIIVGILTGIQWYEKNEALVIGILATYIFLIGTLLIKQIKYE